MHTKIKFTHSFAFWKLQKKHLPGISIIGHVLPPVVQPVIQAQQHMPTKPMIQSFKPLEKINPKLKNLAWTHTWLLSKEKKIINKMKPIT